MSDHPEKIYGKIDGYFVTHDKNKKLYDCEYIRIDKYEQLEKENAELIETAEDVAKKANLEFEEQQATIQELDDIVCEDHIIIKELARNLQGAMKFFLDGTLSEHEAEEYKVLAAQYLPEKS